MQRDQLQGHSLYRVWNNVRPILEESQLLELHEFDSGSDGFSCPFGFVNKQGVQKDLLNGLAFTPFDNFVWILDGLVSWLMRVADIAADDKVVVNMERIATDHGFTKLVFLGIQPAA